MAKKKERSETEYVRSENRKLKSTIRELTRQIARLSKKNDQLIEVEEVVMDFPISRPVSNSTKCSCGEYLDFINLGAKKLEFCESCGHRKVIINKAHTAEKNNKD